MSVKRMKAVVYALVCTMLLTGLMLPAAAADTTSMQDTVLVLQRLGILDEDASGGAEDAVSRAEFTQMAVRALGVGNAYTTEEGSGFIDVPDAHPYAGVVEQARKAGLVSGNGSGYFYPDDKISYAEAAKILVTLTGYNHKVSSNDTSAYMVMATQIGIFRGIGELNHSMAAQRGNLYKMVENALEIDMLRQTGFGVETTFETQRGVSVMTEYLKVQKYEGMVTATSKTGYQSKETDLHKDQIEIDGTAYQVLYETSIVSGLLGHQVEAYVDISDLSEDILPIVLLRDRTPEERIVSVSAENIKEDTTTRSLSYYEETGTGSMRSMRETISETANVIYNGVYCGKAHMLEDSDLKPMTGSVTLVDTDGAGGFDLVQIEDVRTIVVADVNTVDRKIMDYYKRPTLNIDTSAELTITKRGKEITLADLADWDVLAIKIDRDETQVDIDVSSSKVSGQITEMGDDTITVEGEVLEIAESLEAFMAENQDSQYIYELGDSGSFCLDVDGKVAAVDIGGSAASSYGYMIEASMSKGMDSTCYVKMLTQSGEVVMMQSATRLTIDGIGGQNSTDLYNRLMELDTVRPVGNPTSTDEQIIAAYTKQNKLVVYSTNADGEISEIDTVVDNPEENGKGLKISYPVQNKRYKMYNKFSGGTENIFMYDGNLKIFNVPPNVKDENAYSTSNLFSHDSFYNVTAYNKEDGIVPVVCNFIIGDPGDSSGDGGSTPIGTNVDSQSALAVVEKVTKAAAEDGSTTSRIYVFSNGQSRSYNVTPDRVLPELKFGDIIQYGTDFKGEISDLVVRLSASEDTAFSANSLGGSFETVYGLVYEKYSTAMDILTDATLLDNPPEGKLIPYTFSATTYYIDMVEEEVRSGSSSDIVDYVSDPENASTVYLKAYYDKLNFIVIYKWN